MFETRIEKLHTLLEKYNCDALLVSNFYNILYLTGCKTLTAHEREAFALVTKKNVYIFSDGRYEIAMKKRLRELSSTAEFKLISYEHKLIDHITSIIEYEKITKIGFEATDITYAEFEAFKIKLKQVDFIPLKNIVLQIRATKDKQEIQAIQKACQLTDNCLENIVKTIKVGITEKQLSYHIEQWVREKGYELSFTSLVAFDENAALPHYDTSVGNGRAQHGSVILIDMGIKYEDYCSDITRMFFLGTPSTEIKNAYEALLSVQNKSLEKLNHEKEYKNIDIFCRTELMNKGYQNFSHSTGHGVGLEVHEDPKISQYAQDVKKTGEVITIEPGIYIPGKFGMRIEDTVLIDDDMNAIVLTQYPKEMMII